MSNETEIESILRNEVFNDDSFFPDLELDIMTTRPASDTEGGCMDVLFRYICECDFWKVLPTFLVSNAFSCSITVLTTCRVVHRERDDQDANTSIDDQFGLWSYKDSQGECQAYDLECPTSILSLNDQLFRSSRGLAIVAACLGFFTMAGLWMGALRDHVAPKASSLRTRRRARWKICVGSALILCSMIQGMALLILRSDACHSTTTNTSSRRTTCRLGDGGWWVVAATLQYLVTGFLVLGWPCAFKNYTHATLAADESEADQHAYPAEVADDGALWGGFWKGLGSEEVELIDMPTAPYTDNVDEVTNPAGNTSRPSLPYGTPSLRDLLLGFDTELMVSFEPMNADHQMMAATATAAVKPPFVEMPPAPRVVEPPSVSLERLRQQSKIAPSRVAVVVPVSQSVNKDTTTSLTTTTTTTIGAAPASSLSSMQVVEIGSRDSLKSILNGRVPPPDKETREQIRMDINPHRQNRLANRRVPAATTQEASKNGINSILDAFDDDTM